LTDKVGYFRLKKIKFITVSKHLYFFLKHFSGPESGILEFDWLLTRVPPVQFFPIRNGFVMVTARINRAKTIE